METFLKHSISVNLEIYNVEILESRCTELFEIMEFEILKIQIEHLKLGKLTIRELEN